MNETNRLPPKRKHSRFYFLNLTYKNNLKNYKKINLFFVISSLKNMKVPQKLCSEPEMCSKGEKEVVWWNKLRLVVFLAATKDKDIFVYLKSYIFSIYCIWLRSLYWQLEFGGQTKHLFSPLQTCGFGFVSHATALPEFPSLVPAEVDLAGTVSSFFHEWLVELPASTGVDVCPAELAVILQTGDVGTKERSELPSASRSLTLVAQLVIQDVRLHLHLCGEYEIKKKYSFYIPFVTVLFFLSAVMVKTNLESKFHNITNELGLVTRLSMSPCCSWTNRALMAAM